MLLLRFGLTQPFAGFWAALKRAEIVWGGS